MPINRDAYEAFLQSREGLIGRAVESLAADTANFARDGVRNILRNNRALGDEVAQSISYEQEGVEAFVGIEDSGDVSRYLSEKAVREQPGWMREALERATQEF